MSKMKVGVLGSGDVGRALATGFVSLGPEVKIGSREPGKLASFVAAQGERASSGTFAETARFGDLLILATLGTATEDVIRLAGVDNFAGKVVIDTTNPLDFSGGTPPKLFVGHTDSLGERVQRWIPRARVVKAYNTVGNSLMVNPKLAGGPPTMFIAGNDDGAKKIVSQVCEAFGWESLDLGGIEASRWLEPMCVLWVVHGFRSGQWNHAFKMLRG